MLDKLKEKIEKIEITYDYDETYSKLYNTVIDYMNESQDWSFEDLFNDFIDYEIAEEIAKQELERGGLERLRYYINDTTFFDSEIFKIDGYGNLSNIYKNDLNFLKSEILDKIEEEMR